MTNKLKDFHYPDNTKSPIERIDALLKMSSSINVNSLEGKTRDKFHEIIKYIKLSKINLEHRDVKKSIESLNKLKKCIKSIKKDESPIITDNENNEIGFGHTRKVALETIDEIIKQIESQSLGSTYPTAKTGLILGGYAMVILIIIGYGFHVLIKKVKK